MRERSALPYLWLSAVVIGVDQASKQLALVRLHLHEVVSILPFFNLRLVYNPGAAFSFLSTASGWQRWFLTALALTISVVLMFWLARTQRTQTLLALALALILGGALGNVIDRIAYGYVIDFIDLYYRDWHWPAFNVADAAITLGVSLLLIDGLRKPAR